MTGYCTDLDQMDGCTSPGCGAKLTPATQHATCCHRSWRSEHVGRAHDVLLARLLRCPTDRELAAHYKTRPIRPAADGVWREPVTGDEVTPLDDLSNRAPVQPMDYPGPLLAEGRILQPGSPRWDQAMRRRNGGPLAVSGDARRMEPGCSMAKLMDLDTQ